MFSFVMAAYDDFHGVEFTVQAARALHGDLISEVVVADNHPAGPEADRLRRFCDKVPRCRYVAVPDPVGTAAPRNAAIAAATAEYVVCGDSHVIPLAGSFAALAALYDSRPDVRRDLIHGPLVGESFADVVGTHLKDSWGGRMWGQWAYDPRVEAEPLFEIPAMGFGLFATRKADWIPFNQRLRGFGGEEYVHHKKYRALGRRVWCLSALRWWHKFAEPGDRKYPSSTLKTARNFVIGLTEIGEPLDRARDEFLAGGVTPEKWDKIVRDPDDCGCLGDDHPAPVPAVKPTRETRRAAWADWLDKIGKAPIAFRIRTADEIHAWLTEHAPKADRYVAVHGVETFGEFSKPGQGHPPGTPLGLMPGVRKYLSKHPEWSVLEFNQADGGLLVLSKADEDRPKIEPGVAEKVARFALAKLRHHFAGGRFLPLPMAQERLDVCWTCKTRSGNQCAKCSCYLDVRPDGTPGKVFHPRDSCPHGKWLAVAVPAGGFPPPPPAEPTPDPEA